MSLVDADLSDLGPSEKYPIDVPQGGTWALWIVLVVLTILFLRAAVFIIVS